MCVALYVDSEILALVTISVGVLAHELVLVAVPGVALWRGSWKTFARLAPIPVLVLLATRLGAHGDMTLARHSLEQILHSPVTYLKNIATSWGGLWVTALAGLILLRDRRLNRTAVGVLCVLLAASFVVTDTIRVMLFMLPVIVAPTAAFLSRVWERSRALGAILGALLLANAFVRYPSILIPSGSLVSGKSRLTVELLGLLLACAAAFLLVGGRRDRVTTPGVTIPGA